jgi:hypothetical protein
MNKDVKQIYKIILGYNGLGLYNRSSSIPIETTAFPNGDIAFRYDTSSTGLPPNYKALILTRIIPKEELEKTYPMIKMYISWPWY